MTIWELMGMTKEQRTAHIEAGGKVIYPASFWALMVFAAAAVWFLYAAVTAPPSAETIERRAEMSRESEALGACMGQLKSSANYPSTFDYHQGAARKTDTGYIVEVHYDLANAFNVVSEYRGVCEVTAGKVVNAQVEDRR